jgi:hypothetical protein
MALPVTLRHVYDFGTDRALVGNSLANAASWDNLRTRTEGPFGLAGTRLTWEHASHEQAALAARAAAINAWGATADVASIASYGVGAASLELLMWEGAPSRRLICADYGPATVQRLAGLFPEAEVRQHDFLADPPLDAEVHLFHRVDTELSNQEWRGVFQRFETERVFVVAAEVMDLRLACTEIRRRLVERRATRAGWLRNRSALERLWRHTHTAVPLAVADLQGWDLSPR